MGLDTTHGCWHGPYSSFARWRQAVWEAAGWPTAMDGHYPTTPTINWDAVTDANIVGEWDSIPEDPLVVLIAHSDCDGVIPIPALLPLADRLDDIAARMTPTQGQKSEDWLAMTGAPALPPRATYDGERAATVRFADGLRLAASRNEPVEFG